MTRVSDQSRYDGADLVNNADAFWLNAADPNFVRKAQQAAALGKPWGPYSWVDPGNGAFASQRAYDAVQSAGVGVPPLGYALDYEEAGVSQVDLMNALDRAESLGTFSRTWVYTYLYIIGSIANVLRGCPLWLAYYPGNNDGSYPAGQETAALNWGAWLWQYTSTNGTADMSEVVNQDAWNAWLANTSTPAPVPAKGTDDMWIVEKRDGGQPDQYWEPADGGCVQLAAAEAFSRLAAGIPHIEMPTLGLIGYSLRRRKVLRDAIAA